MKDIKKQWITWAKDQVQKVKDGGFLIFSSYGAMFRVNKASRNLHLVFCVPAWLGSETEKTNTVVFQRINYDYVVPENVPQNPKAALKELFFNFSQYSKTDVDTFVKGVGIVYGLDYERVIEMMQKMPIKEPMNPVTIYGDEGNLTVSRMKVRSNAIVDAPIRFNPQNLGQGNYESPVALAFWHDVENLEENSCFCCVDESDYLNSVKYLQLANCPIRLHGRYRYESDISVIVTFEKQEAGRLFVTVKKETIEYKVVLNFEKFIDGMAHLFPNGEIL